MTRTQARERIRRHLNRYAPQLLPILIVAWGPMPHHDAAAIAALFAAPARRLATTDLALVFFDETEWRSLSARERRDLVDHEAAHLIEDARTHARSLKHHGLAWRAWFETLQQEG